MGEFFSKRQIGYSSGGPKDTGLLYDTEEFADDLKGDAVKTLCLEECLTYLDEGPGHQGEASVVRIVFRKNEL